MEPTDIATPSQRTRVACKACNARRVKCDANEGQPCWHCRMRRIPCELIESKRGKYARRRRTGGNQRASRHVRRVSDTCLVQQDLVDPIIRQDNEIERPGEPAAVTMPNTPAQGSSTCQNMGEGPEDISPTVYYVIELSYKPNGGSTEPLTVHHPIPSSIADNDTAYQPQGPISLQEALSLPSPEVLDQLVYTFFHKIHPAYPVFDRERFLHSYCAGQASPLVLQAIALLGFTIGSDDLVREAGFNDRATARKTHYLRAKALYDADYEPDRMNLVAVLLLLGFWWARHDDQKDTCYWVGCASSLAQSLGMHRSVQQSTMSQRMKCLRKRIWWAIYTRDRHVSAAFGRPFRIRDEDCDVEFLAEEDFTFDTAYMPGLIPAQEDHHVSYVLEMSKLAAIIGDIITAEYSPRRTLLGHLQIDTLKQRLTDWEVALPDQLRIRPSDSYRGASFWASMAQFSYQNTIILLYRPKAVRISSLADTERDLRARAAADSITRLAEDLLSSGMITSGLIHLVPALFSALSVHTVVICRGEPIHKQLAENKSQQCMLALSVIAKSWPVRIWISRAFVNLIKRLTGQGQTFDSAFNGAIVNVSSSIKSNFQHKAPSAGRSSGVTRVHIAPNSDPCCTSNAAPQPGGDDCFSSSWKPSGDFVHDSLWADYLDNALDVDLLLHSCADPTQRVLFEGINWDLAE
ncbi:hypothetical protein P170DRAFT_397008 [Aspergillus steynii IBT 23096]|uniref:Zn(2)-C6 fungal-type domain-containing protein n=1 Tax=Aspergillus steynii IBT 23096 TaxID=1392250 RepID=A0A2I2GMA6_9EURO|nr:uncharacterized protein P170DRAFT_397008 [Aspergillus steynii IBT 23096]PLB54004.1 hypothetical protein P170DRAFT_397008 [Aspergillus steynii IBT 23096]